MNGRAVDLRQMRYFVAVAEELHFGRAAERLYITQPSLSAQISALEDELGARLLDRNSRRVSLTGAGEAFLEGARRTLSEADRAVSEAGRAANGEVGSLAVGFVNGASLGLLPPVLGAFGARYPGIKLELLEMNTSVQLGALRGGRIDVGVVAMLAEEAGDPLEVRGLVRTGMIAALPEGHPLSCSRRVGVASLAEEPLMVVARHLEPHLHGRTMRLFGDEGLRPRVAQEAGGLQILLGLVSEGVGVAVVPAPVRNVGRAGVAYRGIREETPTVGLSLAWRRDDGAPVLRAFLDAFAEVSEQGRR